MKVTGRGCRKAAVLKLQWGRLNGTRVRRFATVGRQGGSRERHPGPCAKTLCVPQHRNPIAGAVPQPRPESFSGPPDLELPVTAILPGAAAPCPVRTGSITARRGKECPHHARVAERGDKFFCGSMLQPANREDAAEGTNTRDMNPG